MASDHQDLYPESHTASGVAAPIDDISSLWEDFDDEPVTEKPNKPVAVKKVQKEDDPAVETVPRKRSRRISAAAKNVQPAIKRPPLLDDPANETVPRKIKRKHVKESANEPKTLKNALPEKKKTPLSVIVNKVALKKRSKSLTPHCNRHSASDSIMKRVMKMSVQKETQNDGTGPLRSEILRLSRKSKKYRERACLTALLHSMGLLNCHLCQKSHPNFGRLRHHMLKDHKLGSAYIFCCETKFYEAGLDHMRFHQNKEAFKCNSCGELLKSKNDLKNHLFASCVEKKPYHKCRVCEATFKNKYYLNVHKKTHGPEALKWKCKACNNAFNRSSQLLTHISVEHPELGESVNKKIRFNCEHCAKSYVSLRSLLYHQNASHELRTPTECKICHEMYISWEKHRRDSHAPCKVCGEKFTREKLQIHMETHPEIVIPLKCETCARDYGSLAALRRHMKKHPEAKPLSPEFIIDYYHNYHKRNEDIGKPQSVKSFICEICGKECTRREFWEHKQSCQSGSKVSKRTFDSCVKIFKGQRGLTKQSKLCQKESGGSDQDQETSNKTRPSEECHICKRNFYNLKKHIADNHDVKIPCEICGKEFSKHRLKFHMETHSATKHKCPECDKQYTVKHTLLVHIKRVHKGAREKCLFCPVVHVVVKPHMKSVHPEEYADYVEKRRKRQI